jgi:hypothetical protein
MNIAQRQTEILKRLKLFSDKRLDKITRDDFTFKGMSREEMKTWMDCVWITLGKEQATNKEMTRGLNEVLTLAHLEFLERKGLLKINKKGYFDRTKLGYQVLKHMKMKELGEKK